LTALYEKYKDEGFVVLGVNGYDEPKDLVANYLKDENLTHPVVLMGGRIASEEYHVRGYPTSYWVDHTGKLAGREVGFGQGGEKKLIEKVEQLLEARNGKKPADKPYKLPVKAAAKADNGGDEKK
jgi:hypothetical protein